MADSEPVWAVIVVPFELCVPPLCCVALLFIANVAPPEVLSLGVALAPSRVTRLFLSILLSGPGLRIVDEVLFQLEWFSVNMAGSGLVVGAQHCFVEVVVGAEAQIELPELQWFRL